MKLPKVNESCTKSDGLKALVVLFNKENEKYVIESSVEKSILEDLILLLERTKPKAKSGDLRVLWCKDGEYDLVCAAGLKDEDSNTVRKTGALAYKTLLGLNVSKIIISYSPKIGDLSEGVFLASFSYDYLKGEKKQKPSISPEKECPDFNRAFDVSSAQNFCRFLAETPANFMTPKLFSSYARDYLEDKSNIELFEFDRKWIENNKMGLFLSVSKGSNEEPRFLVVKYRGGSDDVLNLALVGKGITFDSGGISLKPSLNMGEMKMDMTGAASVIAIIGLISRMKVELNVDAFIPLCENLPSDKASKPGDVAVASNGKTVEIDNTDAEGRLILADAMVYAQKSNPEYMVDVATLTGAISVALGSVYSGMFSNNDALADLLICSGATTGDLVWRMPLDEQYRSQLDSTVADIKNCGTRHGGSCVAAIFLKEFVSKDVKWAHIDIAGVMSGSYFSDIYGKGSTGLSVRMLAKFVEKISCKE